MVKGRGHKVTDSNRFISDKNSGTHRLDSIKTPTSYAAPTPSLRQVIEDPLQPNQYISTMQDQTDYTKSVVSDSKYTAKDMNYNTMKSFHRRGNSVVSPSPMTSLFDGGMETNVGNFGHPVHLPCPKDFTLTPVHKLQPMGFDFN